MSPRRTETVQGSGGGVRAIRLHLREDAESETMRSEPAEPGLRVDFDAQGRPLALEIDAGEPIDPGRIDRVLAALGEEGLTEAERAAIAAAR